MAINTQKFKQDEILKSGFAGELPKQDMSTDAKLKYIPVKTKDVELAKNEQALRKEFEFYANKINEITKDSPVIKIA